MLGRVYTLLMDQLFNQRNLMKSILFGQFECAHCYRVLQTQPIYELETGLTFCSDYCARHYKPKEEHHEAKEGTLDSAVGANP